MRIRSPWAVPAAVAVAVAAAVVAPPLLASAGEDLPEIGAEELLARVAAAEPQALSGTVVYTARLGLPDLPMTEATGADPLMLLGGSSTMRVWSDGDERSRVALLGATSEYSVVHDGLETWTYSSADDEAVHYVLDDADAARAEAMAEQARARQAEMADQLPTPQDAARQVLEHADEYANVSVDAPTTVAGRGAYQLVVTPRDDATLVGRIVVAVDADTASPLRVQVWSTQDPQLPAIELGFTDVTFAAPADAVLTFTPPAGTTVREQVVDLPDDLDAMAAEGAGAAPAHGTEPELPEGVSVTGAGWSTVVTLTDVDVAALVAGDPAAVAEGTERVIGSAEAQDLVGEFMGPDGEHPATMDLDTEALYQQLTTEVPEGRLLSSALLSVLVTNDGRVLVGAVPADTLRGMA